MRTSLFVLLLFVSLSANAADFDPARLKLIGPRMQEFVDQQEIAGAVTVVGNRQGIVSYEAVGLASVEPRQPIAKDSLFKIASMTKPITAIAVMLLVDEGKVSVDEPVEKYLPEFRGQLLIKDRSANEVTLKKPARPITVRDLLTHTSGLPGGFPDGIADLYVRRQHTLAEAVMASSQRPLEFEPGSKWAYCNAGIDTLGRIVEVVSGESFERFLAERVFVRLGMKDTQFYPTRSQEPRIAQVYALKEGAFVPANHTVVGPGTGPGIKHPVPAGGLYSTGADLARLYQMMLNRGELNGVRILSPESVATMTQLQTGDLKCGFVPGMGFGFGWAVVREPQGVTEMLSAGTFGHGGAFGTQGWIDPRKEFFVILLIQRVGLKNGDGTDMRRDLQKLAVDAMR